MILSGRLFRICLLGQPFWVSRLKDTIQESFPDQYDVSTFLPQHGISRKNLAKLANADVLVRVGYRPGAATPLGRFYDLAWKVVRHLNPTASVAYYWIGTDVLNAVREVKRGCNQSGLLQAAQRSLHIVDVPWLRDELEGIGVNAVQIHYPAPILKAMSLPPLPSVFSVLTYIPDRRFRFYGGLAIAEAAKQFPSIPFHVVGGSGSWLKNPPPNLQFHGWQKDLDPFYRSATVVVRLVEHDALGASVQEGLCYGRYVIYSYPVPHCLRVTAGDTAQFFKHLRFLLGRHAAGLLEPNEAGWSYGMREYDERQFCAQFLNQLLQYSGIQESPGFAEEVA